MAFENDEDRRAYFRNRRREWYLRNRETELERMRTRQRTAKIEAVELKGGACMDCGFRGDPVCFHFDHRDPHSKTAGVSVLLCSADRPALLAELDKCDLVCANCHAIRTSRSEAVRAKQSEARRKSGSLIRHAEGRPTVGDDAAERLQDFVARTLPVYLRTLAEAGLHSASRKAYETDLRTFARWCSYRGLPVTDLSDATIETYLAARAAEGSARSAIKRAASSLRSYRRFLSSTLLSDESTDTPALLKGASMPESPVAFVGHIKPAGVSSSLLRLFCSADCALQGGYELKQPVTRDAAAASPLVQFAETCSNCGHALWGEQA